MICGPSGVGKTSLVKELVCDTSWELSVSHTTRPPRAGEVDGVNYYFVDQKQFVAMKDRGEFLEYARVFGHYYGTSHKWVRDKLDAGVNIILEIDWQGAVQARHCIDNCYLIMIAPPSIAELKRRLRDRNQDSEDVIGRRMKKAVAELSHYREFDYLVVNEAFDIALDELKTILQSLHCTVKTREPYLHSQLPEVVEAGNRHLDQST